MPTKGYRETKMILLHSNISQDVDPLNLLHGDCIFTQELLQRTAMCAYTTTSVLKLTDVSFDELKYLFSDKLNLSDVNNWDELTLAISDFIYASYSQWIEAHEITLVQEAANDDLH
jgi:hypothetical protein